MTGRPNAMDKIIRLSKVLCVYTTSTPSLPFGTRGGGFPFTMILTPSMFNAWYIKRVGKNAPAAIQNGASRKPIGIPKKCEESNGW
eukprot:c29027_g3_i1 orf=51-308(+)